MGIYSPILYPVPLTRGGLGADVSAYQGIVYIANGAAGQVSLGPGTAFDPNTGELTGYTTYRRNGSLVGSRPGLNLIEGDGVAILATDNPALNRVDVQISCSCGDGTSLLGYGQIIRPLIQPTGPVDNVNTTFTLPDIPTAGSEHVYVNGLLQEESVDYTITGNVLEFTDPLVSDVYGTDVPLIDYWPTGGTAESAQRITRETPTGLVNGSNTVFSFADYIYSPASYQGYIRVWKNGVAQLQNVDFTLGPGDEQITFTDAPVTGDDIVGSYWTSTPLAPTLSVFTETPPEVPDGVITNFTLDFTPASNSLHVYKNGILEQEGTDFLVLGGPQVQFTTAPLLGDELVFFYDIPGGTTAFLITNRVMYETPTGLVNGANVTFTLANDAMLGYVEFYVEGEQLHYTAEFTQGGTGNRTLTLAVAPLTGNRVWANYWRA